MADNRNARFCLRVPVRTDEAVAIKSQAQRCGLSTAAYLRNVGLGHPVTGVFEAEAVLALSRANRELACIGELLEQWLQNDDRLSVLERATLTRNIGAVLAEIKTLQATLLATVQRV